MVGRWYVAGWSCSDRLTFVLEKACNDEIVARELERMGGGRFDYRTQRSKS